MIGLREGASLIIPIALFCNRMSYTGLSYFFPQTKRMVDINQTMISQKTPYLGHNIDILREIRQSNHKDNHSTILGISSLKKLSQMSTCKNMTLLPTITSIV